MFRCFKSRVRLGSACYYSVQNILSSRLLSKNLKIKICRTIILPVVLYGCETWSLTLLEERRLRVEPAVFVGMYGCGNHNILFYFFLSFFLLFLSLKTIGTPAAIFAVFHQPKLCIAVRNRKRTH